MKTTIRFLFVGLALLAAGCVTQVQPEKADIIAAVIRPVAKNTVNLVLAKNPKYEEALLALATAADVANGGTLTPDAIKAFVDTFALKYALDAETKLIIASAIDDVIHAYTDVYGKLPEVGDANVQKYLAAFAKGIRDGIAFRHSIAGAP